MKSKKHSFRVTLKNRWKLQNKSQNNSRCEIHRTTPTQTKDQPSQKQMISQTLIAEKNKRDVSKDRTKLEVTRLQPKGKKIKGVKRGFEANGIPPKSISLEAHVIKRQKKRRNQQHENQKDQPFLVLLGCRLLLRSRLRTGRCLGHAARLGRRDHLGLFNHGGCLNRG